MRIPIEMRKQMLAAVERGETVQRVARRADAGRGPGVPGRHDPGVRQLHPSGRARNI